MRTASKEIICDEHGKPCDFRILGANRRREQKDLIASYQLGVNAYVVKPVDFDQFVSAVKDLGLFWLVVNDPPPPAGENGR